MLTLGAAVYAYTDSNCTEGRVEVPVGIENCYSDVNGLGSFTTVCSS